MFDFQPDACSVVPIRYRQVALSTGLESLDPAWLADHLVGKEAYMRTRFIVARSGADTALLEIIREPGDGLFRPIEHVRVLSAADACRYIVEPEIDCGVPSQLAAVAARHTDVACVVVEGRYSHVSFILNSQPLVITVVDIVPPFPSKLLDQVQRVLDVAEELPPIVIDSRFVDSRKQLVQDCDSLPADVLVPCRGSGISVEGANLSFLDERPAAADWTLLGCERSHQIHAWFYGGAPRSTVDICPRRFLSDEAMRAADSGAVLSRCCLLQEGMEQSPEATLVPWGASLIEVRQAIESIVERSQVVWTPV